LKTCRKCATDKPETEFGRNGKRLRSECKPCRSKATQAWVAANPQKRQRWLAANKDRVRKTNRKAEAKRRASDPKRNYRWRISKFYGLTEEDVSALHIVQNGKCAICRALMDPPHIDHDHSTGKVRGLLCAGCNFGLGHFKDSIDNLRSAITYLGHQNT
jgi:hypothetical protein